MHAHLNGRERQACRRRRGDSYGIGKNGQLQMYVRPMRGRARNADRVVARITSFDSDSIQVTVVAVRVMIVVMLA
jgi:hypothetical protein